MTRIEQKAITCTSQNILIGASGLGCNEEIQGFTGLGCNEKI